MKQIRFSIEAVYHGLARLPPPLIFLFSLGVMSLSGGVGRDRSISWLLLVVGLFSVGLLIALWALLGLRLHHTTLDPIHPEQSRTLVTTGVYHLSRNPMYLSLLLWLLAWGCWLQGGWWGVLPFWLWMDKVQIPREERALGARFGHDYRDYCRRVRRWC